MGVEWVFSPLGHCFVRATSLIPHSSIISSCYLILWPSFYKYLPMYWGLLISPLQSWLANVSWIPYHSCRPGRHQELLCPSHPIPTPHSTSRSPGKLWSQLQCCMVWKGFWIFSGWQCNLTGRPARLDGILVRSLLLHWLVKITSVPLPVCMMDWFLTTAWICFCRTWIDSYLIVIESRMHNVY